MSITTKILVFSSLLILAVFVTTWTYAAYDLVTWGWRARGTLGDATFLPYPTGPRGVLLLVFARMSPVDEFIYVYLLETGALTALCLFLWAGVVFSAFKMFPSLLRKQSSTRQKIDPR